MGAHTDNRAVSAFFRVFGGMGRRCVAEACQHTGFRGMHVGECLFLAVIIPLTVIVAVAEGLGLYCGTAAGWMLAIPAAFVLTNLLPWALGGNGAASQWRRWLALCTLWAVFRRDAGGVAGVFAWIWICLFILNAGAFLLCLLGRSFAWKGKAGIVWRSLLFIVPHLAALGLGMAWGWPWALVVGAVLAALYCAAVLRPGCQWLGPVTCHGHGREILITIDDGPDPRDTPALLDLLDEHQAKAVFFMIGEKVAAHPELAREVVRRGHEIGNHTMTHPQASFWCAGPWRTQREISRCQRVIEQTVGVTPRWFRAPVGHRNLFTHPVASMLGLKVMAWNRRGFDAVVKDPEKVLARILPSLGPGDIVLLHENTPIAAEVLADILAKFAQLQCEFPLAGENELVPPDFTPISHADERSARRPQTPPCQRPPTGRDGTRVR
jgi:peptidoglycan/xylan/chitin deacetylase (PgdA/CDA1 family)